MCNRLLRKHTCCVNFPAAGPVEADASRDVNAGQSRSWSFCLALHSEGDFQIIQYAIASSLDHLNSQEIHTFTTFAVKNARTHTYKRTYVINKKIQENPISQGL